MSFRKLGWVFVALYLVHVAEEVQGLLLGVPLRAWGVARAPDER